MKSAVKLTVLFIPFLMAANSIFTNIAGTYILESSDFGSHTLVVKSDGHFIETTSGCIYNLRQTGSWKVNRDTLMLSISKRFDLRTKRREKVLRKVEKYLILSDSLVFINKDNSGVRYILVREK